MNQELSCSQVSALMSFYLENKLSEKLTQYISHHLSTCPACAEKYENFKRILKKYSKNEPEPVQEDEFETQFMTKQYETFKSNLSAYIDNELDDEENIKIKKAVISNPLARQDLEDIYALRQLLHSAFEKTRNDIRIDLIKPDASGKKVKSSFLSRISALLNADSLP